MTEVRSIKRKHRNLRKKKAGPVKRFFGRMTDGLNNAVAVSATGRYLANCDTEGSVTKESFLFSLFKRLFKKIDMKRVKFLFQRGIENSRIMHLISRIVNSVLVSHVRQYGMFVFSLGLYTLLLYFLGNYAVDLLEVSIVHLALGAAEIVCSIPMLISGKTLADALLESRSADLLLFKFLGISEESLKREKVNDHPIGVLSIVLGLLTGLATTFVSPFKVLLAAVVLILMCIAITSPESGLVCIIAVLPFLSEGFLQAAVFYLMICYVLKVLRGKRVFKFELADYTVLIFALLTLVGGIFSVAPEFSRGYAPVIATYICIYFLIVNTVKTKPWIGRMIFAVSFSLVSSVLCGMLQRFLAYSHLIRTEDIFSDTVVRATFASPTVLAQFIILFGFYLSAVYFTHKMSFVRRVFLLMIFFGMIACMVFTLTPLAMLCYIAAMLLFLVICSRRTLIFAVIIGAALPFVQYLLPDFVLSRINDYIELGKTAVVERADAFRASVRMIGGYAVGGSGTGTYPYLFAQNAADGVDMSVNAHNTYLQMLIELGAVGLIIFVVLIILFLRNNLSLFAKLGTNERTVYSAAGMSGIVGILLMGFAESLWVDSSFVIAFWTAMGLCTAINRHALFEHKGYEEYLLGNK